MYVTVITPGPSWQNTLHAVFGEKKLNRIKVVLAERDLNNKWLAEQVGKDPATVSKWVTNTTQPILEALIAIANVLDVTVQDLVRQEEFN